MRVYKICGKCKKQKLAIEFAKHKNRKDGLNSWCKLCNKKNLKIWYKDNNPEHKKTIRERKKKYKEKVQEFLITYFETNPCIDCGEKNPLVLDFDHKDSLNKKYSVGELTMVTSLDLSKIKEEISKCDVRCSNCHRIKTAKERNFSRYIVWKRIQEKNNN